IAASVYVIECRDAMRASGRGNARLTRPTCAGTTDSTMSVTVRRVLAAFAMLGLGASTAASWVHYHLIQNSDYSSFCDVNSTISCKQAYLSAYGSLAGIPVAILGVLFF